MSDKRAAGRYLCADLVRVDWLDGEDDFRSAEAVLEDISQQGACVEMEQAVKLGTMMMLSIDGKIFYGHASHCNFRDYGFFVGIRFSEDTQWSSSLVAPRHLTSLCALAEDATGS